MKFQTGKFKKSSADRYGDRGLDLCSEMTLSMLQKSTFHISNKKEIRQGLKICGLKECGPWRFTVFSWFPNNNNNNTLEKHDKRRGNYSREKTTLEFRIDDGSQ